MREWLRSLRQIYCTVDARSLGLFRIVLGLVLLLDLARRCSELSYWYTNSGLLPNHTLLWRPPTGRLFSLFFSISTLHEAQVAFALCAFVYVMFMLGYRTRLAQVLALIVRVSVNSRLAVLENGGDMVMDLLILLSLPLPLGARFSLDAVGAKLRSAVTGSDEETAWARKPLESYAMLALILQFSAVYLFNASSKTGHAWRDGSAVYYALHQDKLVTWIGVWMREGLPPWLIQFLTKSTLAVEWLGFMLILTPLYVRQARLMAVLLMPPLHLGFALGLNLGGFSPGMMAFYPLLLATEHWDWLEQRVGKRVSRLSERVQELARKLVAHLSVPIQRAPSHRWRLFSEGAILIVMFAVATEVVNDNTPVPKELRFPQPDWCKAIIEYPRILQGWRMFAPEPPRGDSMMYVEATTAGGKKVDPYNEVASDQPYPAGTVVPRHMGQSQFFVMYSERLPNTGYAAYRQAFSEWLQAYPERTGHKEDCLLSYDVYFVTDQTPPFGSGGQPTPGEKTRFMNWVAPWDSSCRSLSKDPAAKRQPRPRR
jgi:hypothetical protein